MSRLSSPSDSNEYVQLLETLKERIRSSRLKAALAVNEELILLYWGIGRDILHRQESAGWGAKVIDRLSSDLKRDFSEMTGFSPRNLKYMWAMAEAFPDREIVQRVIAQLPWGHAITLVEAVTRAISGFRATSCCARADRRVGSRRCAARSKYVDGAIGRTRQIGSTP